MDIGDLSSDHGESKPRELPSDLPKSLNDRRHVPVDLVPETEMYDGWQGVLTPRKPHTVLTANARRCRRISVPHLTSSSQASQLRQPLAQRYGLRRCYKAANGQRCAPHGDATGPGGPSVRFRCRG